LKAPHGRTGAAMWGFQRHGLVPDMVSMGKPMGNGYPVAGLVLQPDVIAAFGARARYFNTFGGNAVAAATAMAVLEVIEGEALQANAANVGGYFRDELLSLAKRHECLGDLRAAGLFLGQDIVTDGAPDGALAVKVVNHMRQNGVLISATGPHGHVLKIRPPLVFSPENVDTVIAALDAALA
jgi:4-aminobutyrate aminotransferase-like enzyme